MSIDEVSQALGRIEAKLTIVDDRTKATDDKVTLMNGSVAKLHSRVDETEKGVNDWLTSKRKVLTILALVGGLGLFGGANSDQVMQVTKAVLNIPVVTE